MRDILVSTNTMYMNFSFTEEQLMIKESAKDFANSQLFPGVIDRDENQIFPKEEIKKMEDDAELHAEEDKKAKALVDAKNNAEAMIHASEKSVKDIINDKFLIKKLNNFLKNKEIIKLAIFSSVVPNFFKKLNKILTKKFKIKVKDAEAVNQKASQLNLLHNGEIVIGGVKFLLS